jgi:hypothetical protein
MGSYLLINIINYETTMYLRRVYIAFIIANGGLRAINSDEAELMWLRPLVARAAGFKLK